MGQKTAIAWTEATWNPWHGCTKVSEGCKVCYMYRDKERYGLNPTVVVRSKLSTFDQPLKQQKSQLIFTCSWSDFFIEAADDWRPDAWGIIKSTPQHQYQILTKRPERIAKCLPDDWGEGYPNVWLGVSVENQQCADERIRLLLDIPAAIRFLSVEPLLGPVSIDTEQIDWFIVGGESGNDHGKYQYRPCHLDWIHSIISDCRQYETPVFVKQLGTYLSKKLGLKNRSGADMSEWPSSVQFQQFPITYQS